MARNKNMGILAGGLVEGMKLGMEIERQREEGELKKGQLKQQQAMQEAMPGMIQQIMGQGGGGPQPQAAGGEPSLSAGPMGGLPQMGGMAGMGQTGQQPARMPFDFIPTINYDAKGQGSLAFRGERRPLEITFRDYDTPEGVFTFKHVVDKTTGKVIEFHKTGRPAPPESVQRAGFQASSILQRYGGETGTPLWGEVRNQVLESDLISDPNMKMAYLRQIENNVKATMSGGGAAVGGGMGQAIAEGRQERIQQKYSESEAESKVRLKYQPSIEYGTTEANLEARMRGEPALKSRITESEVETKLRTEPMAPGPNEKFRTLRSVERLADEVITRFNPNRVGKGFQDYAKALFGEIEKEGQNAAKGKYEGGSIGAAFKGSLRQFFGNIPEDEVVFRRAFLDLADALLRARSGAQINEAEFKRLQNILGSFTDEPAVFGPSMERFKKEIGLQIDDLLTGVTTPAQQLLQQRQQRTEQRRPEAPAAPKAHAVSDEQASKIATLESGFKSGKVSEQEFYNYLVNAFGGDQNFARQYLEQSRPPKRRGRR